MPGKVNEGLWERAKASAKKSHPDWDDKNPRLWKVISAIYKKMGGKFSKQVEKSLASIEAAIAATPSFIEDPRIWVGAIKKSCGEMRWGVDDFQSIVKAYAEMGGAIEKSSMLDSSMGEEIQKAAGGVHKYANRVPRPGGGYRYIYPEGQGGGSASAKSGAPAAKPGMKAPAPVKSKTSMAKIVEGLSKRDSREQRAALQNVSDDALSSMHAHAKGGLAKVIDEEKQARKVKAATVKKSQEEFETFSSIYREDIKKSLAESHPDWDAETLERRVEPQVRQMFRLHGG